MLKCQGAFLGRRFRPVCQSYPNAHQRFVLPLRSIASLTAQIGDRNAGLMLFENADNLFLAEPVALHLWSFSVDLLPRIWTILNWNFPLMVVSIR